MIIEMSLCKAFGFTLFGILFLALTLFKKDKESSGSPESNEASFMRDFAEIYMQYYNWWLSVLYASIPQALVGLCYRFDNANSSEVDPSGKVDAEIVEVATPTAVGVMIPKHLSNKFFKPYYLTALTTWCFVNLLFLYLVATNFISFDEPSQDKAYGLFAAIMATPVMLLAIIGLAAIRGELKKMWTYKEEWGVNVKKPDCSEAAAPLLVEVEVNEKVQV